MSNTASISTIFSAHKQHDFAEEHLINDNHASVSEVKAEVSKVSDAGEARITRGMYLMGIGGFVGFLSCLLTMLDLLPEYRGFCLYCLTTIGVSIAFYGAYLVFEKE